MRLKTLSLLPVLAVVCGTILLPAGSASVGATSSLPITSFDQVVADTAQGHLFFSEGNNLYAPGGANAILVTDLGGNPVRTITQHHLL